MDEPQDEPQPEAPDAPAAPPPPDDDARRLSVKLLVVALIGQVILFGGLIALTIHGFPFLGGGGDSKNDNSPASTIPAGTVPRPTVDRFDAAGAMRIARLQVDAGQRPAGSKTLRAGAERLKPVLPN